MKRQLAILNELKSKREVSEKRKQIEKQIQWTFDDGIKNWKANRYRKKKEKSN